MEGLSTTQESEEVLACKDSGLLAHEEVITKRAGPGIMVFELPVRLVHMNFRAGELIRQLFYLNQNKSSSLMATGILPECLLQYCEEIFSLMKIRSQRKDWEQFEVSRIIGNGDPSIFVRGFGMPEQGGHRKARIVVILELIKHRRVPFDQRMKDLYHLTERELATVHCLSKGLTNKEIASALGLALPTVKQHLKHIMEKTKTTTRTGALMQIFRT